MSLRHTARTLVVASTSSTWCTPTPPPSRLFSCTATVPTSKLSRLNKTTLLRQQRLQRQANTKGGDKTDTTSSMPLSEAARVLQALSLATPNAAYEINIQTKPAQTIQLNALRGRVFLPHSCASSTKSTLLVVLASGAQATAARNAGADVVGGEELIDKILNGELNPDKLITTPEHAGLFARNPTLARLLGPRGLMPSAKRGTVASDVATAVKEARGGLDWKGDAQGVVRAAIGRLHFTPDALQDNVHTLLASVSDIALGGNGASSKSGAVARTKRPAITRVLLSSTQGTGITLSDV